MRLAAPAKVHPAQTEQIILFRISSQIFAVSSASVQEVRSVESMIGLTTEITVPGLRKVRQVARRGDKSLYIVNGSVHFGLNHSPGALIFVLRKTRTALLVDGIEKMTAMTKLQALPRAFCHEEQRWYRGLTALDQTVVPVVRPEGFLTQEELSQLDAALPPLENVDQETVEGSETAP